jgi:hypothetical protein
MKIRSPIRGGMKLRRVLSFFLLISCSLFGLACRADDLITMGVTALRAQDPSLNGAGVPVAQPEGLTNATAFEINPSSVGEPQSLFNWISTNGNFTSFPNIAGTESGHADVVGDCIFGASQGVAPEIAHLDNYEADYFYQFVVVAGIAISDQVANQSFTFGVEPPDQQPIDSAYDDYTASNGVIFCSATVGVGTSPGAPGTAYNCIGTGAYGAGAVLILGPTLDNGRSKPDIVAPGVEVSFTTPYVTGAAAILVQAGARGDGGANTSAAQDRRTVKALLLNGALKPFDWSHTTTAPLDTRYGAGVLNLYYSYQQLAAGRHGETTSGTVPSGGAHPPISSGATAPLAGWDFETMTTTTNEDSVNHYLFDVAGDATFTGTLVWERQADETGINNLALFLYNATNGVLLSSSVSSVDNVQHLYLPYLPSGEYDLEVIKYGSPSQSVTPSETCALAFQFLPISQPSLTVTPAGTNLVITWPSSPTLFILQQSASLTPPVSWSNVSATEWITNTTVWVSLNASKAANFYRLSR